MEEWYFIQTFNHRSCLFEVQSEVLLELKIQWRSWYTISVLCLIFKSFFKCEEVEDEVNTQTRRSHHDATQEFQDAPLQQNEADLLGVGLEALHYLKIFKRRRS